MRSPISLDTLLALNDEIACLARAGIPLDRGLLNLGRDISGRLGSIATVLGERLARGESLSQALEGEKTSLPGLYAAVVEAGIKAGHLPMALEQLADSSRRLAEVRRAIVLALAYPLMVVLLAYFLFLFLSTRVAPVLEETFIDFHASASAFVHEVHRLGMFVAEWWWAFPTLILAVAGIWLWQSNRALLIEPGWSGRVLGWIPWFGRLLQFSHAAVFAEVLSLLVDHEVPLTKALPLAAQATGSKRLRRAAATLSECVARGQSISPPIAQAAGLPPMLTWLLGSKDGLKNLGRALRHVAEAYRQRAIEQAELIRVAVPLAMTVLIGGATTVAYVLTIYLPWSSALFELGNLGN